MPTIIFTPSQLQISVKPNTKLLAAAIRAQLPVRYGCAACQCGTCGVLIHIEDGDVSPMKDNERALLKTMHLPTNGSIRLACQTRAISGVIHVDLDFQDTYSPDTEKPNQA